MSNSIEISFGKIYRPWGTKFKLLGSSVEISTMYYQRKIQLSNQLLKMKPRALKTSLFDQEKALIAEIKKWSSVEEKLKINSSRSTITSIYNEAGPKVSNPWVVEAELLSFFTNLMGKCNEEMPCPNTMEIKNGPCVTRKQQLQLIHMVTREEIDVLIQDMPTEKEPWVDGYPIECFTKHWDVVKQDAYAAVHQFFSTGKIQKSWNYIAITLVQKIPTPTRVKYYSPIAWSSTLYKIVVKVLTVRIKKAIHDISG
ncbi:uncharacterized protein LOC132607955 [Lycium barbarum]|uniref:uncharacterized protein LOC132607955 n=1 Tax=Lycium barbarum TaxID=112863 RepID=UPI00293EE200|nr:uncharacterized protein LOC132607955 [Lycium barbarum]